MPPTDQTSPAPSERPNPLSRWRKVAYAAMIIAVIALGATGIGTFLLGRPPMTHWMLMLHVSFAPLFAIGIALVALSWAGRCAARGGDLSCVSKGLVWLILLAGVIVMLSGVVPMTPLFGTDGERLMYYTHRYSAIVLAALVLLHVVTLAKRRKA